MSLKGMLLGKSLTSSILVLTAGPAAPQSKLVFWAKDGELAAVLP
jgi:hypothetical protein